MLKLTASTVADFASGLVQILHPHPSNRVITILVGPAVVDHPLPANTSSYQLRIGDLSASSTMYLFLQILGLCWTACPAGAAPFLQCLQIPDVVMEPASRVMIARIAARRAPPLSPGLWLQNHSPCQSLEGVPEVVRNHQPISFLRTFLEPQAGPQSHPPFPTLLLWINTSTSAVRRPQIFRIGSK